MSSLQECLDIINASVRLLSETDQALMDQIKSLEKRIEQLESNLSTDER